MGFRTSMKAKATKDVPLPEFLKSVWIEEVNDEGETEGVIPWQPWPHLMEIAEMWESGVDDCIVKARQLGLTWLAAAHAVRKMRANRRRVLYIADTELKATMFLQRVSFIIANLPPALRPKVLRQSKTQLVLHNGSELLALPSSSSQGRSWTASVVIFDEAAHHRNAQANFNGIRGSIADKGQFICMSTPVGPGGWFHQYADKQGARFVPWFAHPGRDMEWYERERQNYTDEREFKYEYPSTLEDAFTAPQGLVFPLFDARKHVGEPPVAYEDCMFRVAGVDIGGEDPTAVVICGMARIPGTQNNPKTMGWRFIQYAEFYRKGDVTLSDVTDFLLEWHNKAPLLRVAVGEPPKSPVIAQMTKLRLPAKGAKGDPRVRNLAHKRFLERDWVLIDPKCKHTISEYASYRIKRRTDPNTKEEYESGVVDNHADAKDAQGYAMQFIEGAIRAVGGFGKRKLSWHEPLKRRIGGSTARERLEWRQRQMKTQERGIAQ